MNFTPQKLPIKYAFILSGGFVSCLDVIDRVRLSRDERECPGFGACPVDAEDPKQFK